MLLQRVLLLVTLLERSNAFATLPASRLALRSRASTPLALASTTASDDTTVAPPEPSEEAQAMGSIERALEALTGDPQALLEAVVGLDKGGIAAYDRTRIMDYFTMRPLLMTSRAFDFLQAYRRVQNAWENPDVDRGAVLRSELSQLGPVSVKIGQTLSQRPDILPEDVCEALKGLQTSNAPFPDAEAFQVMAEDFEAPGPIAPGIPGGPNATAPPLFAKLTTTCIASASLGQVYRGTMHDGREIAVKVQRPGALRQCLLDASVIIVALKAITGRFWNGDLLAIFDLVAAGVVEELDFRHEASNAKQFGESLAFLGYVRVPDTIPELTTRRALAMEWVYGNHLSALATSEEKMRMTYMCVEAVTAGLVLTGLVHADPHEGNVMLADDGRLVFLDFGLMSRVESNIQEAFASGIQCVLSKDYQGLVAAFMSTGFVGTPIEWRAKEADPWQLTHPDGPPAEVMAAELQSRMESTTGGGSRFGALSVVLSDMGFCWQMYTPPYVILLIRTFLTLEGIAGKVDPDFNIYEVALPWAVQRALSPSTAAGAATLRQALLTDANTFQWDRIDALLEQQRADAAEAEAAASTAASGAAAGPGTKGTSVEGEPAAAANEVVSGRARLMAQEANAASEEAAAAGGRGASAGAAAQAAQAATPLDSLVTVLGSPGGATLRRVARDLDSTALLLALSSKANRPARRLATQTLAAALEEQFVGIGRKAMLQPKRFLTSLSGSNRRLSTSSAGSAADEAPTELDVAVAAVWPSSEFADQLAAKQRARARNTAWLLLKQHAGQQWRARGRGVLAVGTLAAVVMRVGGAAIVKALLSTAGRGTVAAATMAGSLAVALWQWFKPAKGANNNGANESSSIGTAST